MTHPDERRIALYACRDVGWMERLSTGGHMLRCISCRDRVEAYRGDRNAIRRQAAEVPAGVDWDRLAAEMAANIHLGLEAGECVSETRPARLRTAGWRPAFAAAGLALVLLSALYINFPADQKASLARGVRRIWSHPAMQEDMGVALAATRNGIEVRENGSALTMVNLSDSPAMVVVNTSGSLRARYVDTDTGQVTITNVYAQ